ncbi:MAG: hypothetical protein AAFQ66_09640 [Pseudomonadota bacterium]
MKHFAYSLFLSFLASLAQAGSGEFGSLEEARDYANQLSTIIREDSVEASMLAMHSPDHPFQSSPMGIHVFEQGIIVADNREPELISVSYEDLADLTGENMWPRIVEAANSKSEAELEWYHYDTGAEYSFACYSEWAVPDEVLIMVCR